MLREGEWRWHQPAGPAKKSINLETCSILAGTFNQLRLIVERVNMADTARIEYLYNPFGARLMVRQ
jgi:hypothetical protein